MIENEYVVACTELLVILNDMSFKDYNKIPKEIIMGLEEYKSKEYIFYMDYSKTLKNQKISELTKAMLNVLYKEYWASDEKRKEFEKEERNEYLREEELKRQKYNPDDLFKKPEKIEIVKTEISQPELLPTIKEDSWFEKAKKFIRKLLKKEY